LGKPLSLQEQEIIESLKALRTLHCEGGRVSVDSAEVLDRPGYLSARAAAAALAGSASESRPVIDETALDELGDLMARHLLRLLQRGKSFEEGEAVLRDAMRESILRLRGPQDTERKS